MAHTPLKNCIVSKIITEVAKTCGKYIFVALSKTSGGYAPRGLYPVNCPVMENHIGSVVSDILCYTDRHTEILLLYYNDLVILNITVVLICLNNSNTVLQELPIFIILKVHGSEGIRLWTTTKCTTPMMLH